MRMIRSAIAGILALSVVSAAWGQQFPTVPDHTVIGRIGTGSGSGPSQAIPFTSFLPNLVGTQSANRVFAGPTTGVAALPTFRALVGADLPFPAASTLGGVQSLTCGASTWINALSTLGVLGCTQPNFTDLAGSIALTQITAASITLAKLAVQNNNTVVGNVSGGSAAPIALTATQLTTLVNPATAALPGALPAFPNNTTTYFRGDGTYVTHNCAAVTDASVYCSAARGQMPGEYIESVIATGSATALTGSTPKNITSISLTAGDWDVSGSIEYNGAGGVSVTYLASGLSTVSATLDQTNGRTSSLSMAANVPGTTPGYGLSFGPSRLSFSGTTTVFLVSNQIFTVGTMTGYGIIRARRAR